MTVNGRRFDTIGPVRERDALAALDALDRGLHRPPSAGPLGARRTGSVASGREPRQ